MTKHEYSVKDIRQVYWLLGEDLMISDETRDAIGVMLTAYANLREQIERAKDGLRWYLGSLNDGLFIANVPPSPCGTDIPPDWGNGCGSVVLNVTELSDEKARAIVDAHNALAHLLPSQAVQVDAYLYKSTCDSAEEWKGRALRAEEVSDRLMSEINDMTGQTLMGEPVMKETHKWIHSSKLGGDFCELCGVMKGMRRSALVCKPRPEFDGTSEPFKPEFDGTTPPSTDPTAEPVAQPEAVSRDLLAIGVRARNIEITRQQRTGEPNNEDHALRLGIAAALAAQPRAVLDYGYQQLFNAIQAATKIEWGVGAGDG